MFHLVVWALRFGPFTGAFKTRAAKLESLLKAKKITVAINPDKV